jgi:PhzF family phenazine biosynthesis protein
MTHRREFAQVDVFAPARYLGNPVAVVLDGTGLTDEAMQNFASWTNLSETTFVVPPANPDADYGLRIFTPATELPFAGHPTLGSAHAWLEAGGTPANEDIIVQECRTGLVQVSRSGDTLSFQAPKLLRDGPLEDELLLDIARGLRIRPEDVIAHQWIDNGPGWAAVQLASARQVLDLEPEDAHMRDLMIGVFGTYPSGSDHYVEVRVFAAPAGVREDPVTGSFNAGLAQWLINIGGAPHRYTAGQGARLGRDGVVKVESRDGQVWVGGPSVTCIHGCVDL